MGWPGEQLIIRLWETLSEKGIGSLLKPWQIKREGLAHLEVRRAELLALAQTEKDAEEIRTGQKRLQDFSPDLTFAAKTLAPLQGKGRIEPTIDLPTVVEAAARQTIEDSVRRQVNIAHAIAHAEEALRDDAQEPPSKKIDDDWLYRWRDYAGDVSAETMQHLWGKILAGELKAPGSFSLRALEFLRNLSQEEAEAIERLSRFAIEDIIWRDDQALLDANDVHFSTLLSLQDLGVISGAESVGLERTWKSDDKAKFIKALRSNGKVLVARHDDPKKDLKLKVYLLTAIGRQLLRLGKFQAHPEYLRKVGKAMQAQGFSVVLADFVQVSNTAINLRNEEAIEAQPTVQTDGPASGGPAA
ncbi:MAG: DUF2806 domain-containing protein [Nevskia sp.]|nr:DUF2806 domain-containing protein [Nevskia sp.]